MTGARHTVLTDPAESPALQAVMHLARAMRNISFYDHGHPAVQDAVADLVHSLHPLAQERPEVRIKVIGGYVVVQDVPLLTEHASIGNLAGACHRRGVDAIVVRSGVSRDEVTHLVELLSGDPAALEEVGGMAGALAARGVRRITVERVQGAYNPTWQELHAGGLDVLRGATRSARMGEPLDVKSIRLNVRSIVDNALGDGSLIHNMTAMKNADEYTFVHGLHVCLLAVELSRHLGFPREELEEIATATLVHDIGKVFTPLAILRKPAALDDAEFALVSRHPVDGAAVLASETGMPDSGALVAFEHHIHLDHSGYPKLQRPRELHPYSLIATVADVYDALTTARPYRPALTPHRSIEIMREQFVDKLEPRLLQRFIETLGPYPWGTLLRVSDDVLVAITRPNRTDPDNPYSRAVHLSTGSPTIDEEIPLRAVTSDTQLEIVDPAEIGIDLIALLAGAK